MDQLSKEPANPFAMTGRESNQVAERSMMDAEVARGVAEIQGAMVIAKKFPRDNMAAFNRLMRTCERPTLAEKAHYTYPKGDKTVVGPSIRLAEAIAQCWGNIRFAIDEVEQHEGHSIVKAYAWDIETNTFVSKTFTVNHSIQLKGGRTKMLTDPREIYEMCANQGARRMRACILAVIPGDVVEAAVNACKATIVKKEGGIPIIDRIRKMSAAFERLGVSTAMIENRFKHKIDVISEEELIVLRGIYTSLTDGEGKVADYFEDGATGPQTPTDLEKKPAEGFPSAASTPAAESQKGTAPAGNASEASKPGEAPAAETTTRRRKSAEKKEEPPKDATQPATSTQPAATTAPAPAAETAPAAQAPAPAQTASQPAPAAEAPKTWLERLRTVMALGTVGDMDIIEYCVRKQGAPTVNTLEALGEAAHKWIFDNWEVIENQVMIDRKTNQG